MVLDYIRTGKSYVTSYTVLPGGHSVKVNQLHKCMSSLLEYVLCMFICIYLDVMTEEKLMLFLLRRTLKTSCKLHVVGFSEGCA